MSKVPISPDGARRDLQSRDDFLLRQAAEISAQLVPCTTRGVLPGLTYSAFSRPRREQPDGTYQIHLVKSQNPAYIPSDLEAWPIYYEAIQEALANYPDAHDAAIEAIRETRKQFTGLENLDVPPAPCPSRDRVMQSLSWRQIWQRDRPGGRSYFRGAG